MPSPSDSAAKRGPARDGFRLPTVPTGVALATCILLYDLCMSKRRITITVDDTLVNEVSEAVAQGRVESVSAWVNQAISERVARDQRLAVLADLISEYEAEHGEITADELMDQAQLDSDAAAFARAAASG